MGWLILSDRLVQSLQKKASLYGVNISIDARFVNTKRIMDTHFQRFFIAWIARCFVAGKSCINGFFGKGENFPVGRLAACLARSASSPVPGQCWRGHAHPGANTGRSPDFV